MAVTKTTMKIEDTENATSKELAHVLNLTARRVQQLVTENVISPNENKKYNIQECVNKFYNEKKNGSTARARLYEAQAVKAEIEVQEKKNELVPITEFNQALIEMFSIIATGEDALPGRLASDLAIINEPAKIRHKLLAEIRENRQRVADNIAKWLDDKERSAVKHNSESTVSTDAATEPDTVPVGKPKQSAPKRKRRTRKI